MNDRIYVRGLEGTFIATVGAVPGCMARGTTREEAVENGRRALPEYLELLDKFGVSTERWRQVDPSALVVEDISVDDWFDDDFRPLEEHEIRDFLHQMEGSRAALLAEVRGLSAEDLERRPGPDAWSVRQALEHVATSEVSILDKLEKWPENMATLQAVHRMAFQRFSILEPKDTDIDHRVAGQRWSTRRVMRRILEHEYEHLGHIRRILAELGSQRAPE